MSASQLDFLAEPLPVIPQSIGGATVTAFDTRQLLTRATGFMSAFDYTLNPYVGCSFGCSYCYAAFFAGTTERRENWGAWVEVKQNAVDQLRRTRSLQGKRIYMSSVTDPYQPVERELELTRGLLEVMVETGRQPRLVVQTRSPLVARDADLLSKLAHVRVNMTITTDDEAIRKRFEPRCPGNDRRIEALMEVKRAGVRVGVCLTPMLPLRNPAHFAEQLAALEADVYVAQPFKPSRGPFAASTRQMANDILTEFGWDQRSYRRAFNELRRRIPGLYEGQAGFMPE
ncbi:SPL family radical SAM protein [Longimicrobium sp.]|jgi:DNA repair photolyase|uniref:SPL family radical SAM protein n=1 Tax=Longimicrobium sp. TaxID=2029185 RepID=UPI002F95BF47